MQLIMKCWKVTAPFDITHGGAGWRAAYVIITIFQDPEPSVYGVWISRWCGEAPLWCDKLSVSESSMISLPSKSLHDWSIFDGNIWISEWVTYMRMVDP